MKKTIYLFISFVIIFTTISFADTIGKATVNATAVRIRETQSVESNILTNAYKNDEVEILEENGEWCKVKYGQTIGYAKSEFFTKLYTTTTTNNTNIDNTVTNEVSDNTAVENNIPSNQATENTNTIVEEINLEIGENIVLQSNLKLRVIPSFSSNEKIEISASTNIIIENELGKWFKVTDGGNLSGWVTSQMLKLSVNQISTETPVQEPLVNENNTSETVSQEISEQTTPEPNTVNGPEEEQSQESTTATTNRRGKVIVETARVRSGASTNSEIIGTLDEDEIVTITGEEGNFYKISTSSINGYVSKSLIKEGDVTSRSSTAERQQEEVIQEEVIEKELVAEVPVQEETNTNSGNDVIEFAKQYLGYPYVLGCSTPENGFDCSGFTRYVFGHFGYTLGRTANDQTSLGAVVERENLQTGDLILFYNDAKTRIGHCAIYIGDGNFIHSANPQRGVVIDNINTNSYYNQRFVTARRIV